MNETRRKPTTGRQSPSLFDKWHGIFYMPSRIDEAGHTKWPPHQDVPWCGPHIKMHVCLQGVVIAGLKGLPNNPQFGITVWGDFSYGSTCAVRIWIESYGHMDMYTDTFSLCPLDTTTPPVVGLSNYNCMGTGQELCRVCSEITACCAGWVAVCISA